MGLIVVALSALLLGGCLDEEQEKKTVSKKVVRPQVDAQRKVVVVPVTLRLKAFEQAKLRHHHLVTWTKGKASRNALLLTPVSDERILDALEQLGGKPGDNLKAEAWTKRSDPKHPAPDERAKGSELTIQVVLADGTRHDVSALLEDVDKRGYAWRLAGNRALIAKWRSGCVACLQSCPGSKVANAKATMRDLHHDRSRFRPSKLAEKLGEGAKLTVEISLVVAKKTAAKTEKTAKKTSR